MTDHDTGDWDFLTYDPEETCSICGEPIRPAQAVGHIGNSMIHARCAARSRRGDEAA